MNSLHNAFEWLLAAVLAVITILTAVFVIATLYHAVTQPEDERWCRSQTGHMRVPCSEELIP